MTEKDHRLIITLRAARVNCGMAIEDVVENTPYDKEQIRKWELDSRNISHGALDVLLNLYGVRLNHIFLGLESDFIGKCKWAKMHKAEKSKVI